MAMLVMLSVPVPVLVKVTDWAPLVVPTFWLAKVNAEEFSDTAGAVAGVKVIVASVFQ